MEEAMQQRQRENEWKKERAVLSQRIELQDLQLQELKIREENYKKFNDTILNAYNSLDQSKQNSKIFKEIQQSLEAYSRELIDQKHRNTDSLLALEAENRELRSANQFLQQRVAAQESELLQHREEKPQKQVDNCLEHQRTIRDLQHQLHQEKDLSHRIQSQLQQSERSHSQQCKELEHQHIENLRYQREKFEKEREDLMGKLSEDVLEKTVRIKQEKRHSELPHLEFELHNKENISPQPYMSFKSSPQKNEATPEIPAFKGCIVTAKVKVRKHKETVDTDRGTHREPAKDSRDYTRPSETMLNTSQLRKHEMSVSQFSNLSHMNCKNSNVMEINTQNLLQSSDIFRAFAAHDPMDATLDQSYICNVRTLVQQLQKEKHNLEYLINDLEDKSPSRYRPNERQRLTDQLNQITRELKRAKLNLQEINDEIPKGASESESSKLLKHEIKFMINKLLKAKGQLTESITSNSLSVSNSQIHTRTTSKHFVQSQYRDVTMSHDKSLTHFTRQLNQARSIENFTQMVNDNSSSRSKRFATSSQSRTGRVSSTTNL